LEHCGATTFAHYGTPFGPLDVDVDLIAQLNESAADIRPLDPRSDSREHSLEMHLPYLHKRLEQTGSTAKIVPLVIGNLGREAEKQLGQTLAPFVKDPENAFIVSSDFCHWGQTSFAYAPYSPTGTVDDIEPMSVRPVGGCCVEDTIAAVDTHALEAIKAGSHDAFLASLRLTKNTVCGRHPIGVILASLEFLMGGSEQDSEMYRFKVTKYTTSGKVTGSAPIKNGKGHSVSYVSAYALA
jgi:AmmeMemoRadiSam system protein B